MLEGRNGSEGAARAEGHHPRDSVAGRGAHPAGAAPSLSRVQSAAALLTRIATHLETMARTRSQLPPIQTNRRGLLVRLELWLKRRARSLTRWYVWEQVNFNSATHAALHDTFELVAAFDRRLKTLEQMTGNQRALTDAGYTPAGQGVSSPAHAEQDASTLTAAEIRRLRAEQLERVRVVLDEMRVSFKQLSLELSEAGVMDAPGGSLPRLDELERRIEEVRALCDRLGA